MTNCAEEAFTRSRSRGVFPVVIGKGAVDVIQINEIPCFLVVLHAHVVVAKGVVRVKGFGAARLLCQVAD